MIKFAIKAGLASAAVYYTAEQGVWRDSETTSELYESIKSHACPLIKEASTQLPFELPDLPSAEDASHIGRIYWNAGVKNVFAFMNDIPTYVKNWGTQAYESFESFANTPNIPETPNEKQ